LPQLHNHLFTFIPRWGIDFEKYLLQGDTQAHSTYQHFSGEPKAVLPSYHLGLT